MLPIRRRQLLTFGVFKRNSSTSSAFDSSRPRSHYENLQLTPGPLATRKRIKESYNKLALLWHPDRTDDEAAPEKFAAISASYRILADTELRREYDKWLWDNDQSISAGGARVTSMEQQQQQGATWMRHSRSIDYTDFKAQQFGEAVRRPRYGMDANRNPNSASAGILYSAQSDEQRKQDQRQREMEEHQRVNIRRNIQAEDQTSVLFAFGVLVGALILGMRYRSGDNSHFSHLVDDIATRRQRDPSRDPPNK